MFSCYSNSWCISTNIAQPVQTVISVNLLWLKQDSIFCFEGEGLSKYILFSFWPLSNPSSLDNVWMWRAVYLRIKLPQRVLETTGTPHASSQQHPQTVRGLNCLCLLNNSIFFVLIPCCDVCWPSRRRRQPCCVSRANSFFYKNTLITPVKHPDLIRITHHATFPCLCTSLSWLICTSASTCWTAADRLATALHSCIQNEWAGSETPLSSLPVNTPAAHFPSLLGITLCVFQFRSCVSFCFEL